MANFEDADMQYRESEQQQDYNYQQSLTTETDYNSIGKAQAEIFAAELRDLYTRYQYSTVGDMERSGMITAGEDILSALSKIELFKNLL